MEFLKRPRKEEKLIIQEKATHKVYIEKINVSPNKN